MRAYLNGCPLSVYQSYSSALPAAGLGSGSEREGVFSDGLSFLWEHILILGSLSTSEKSMRSWVLFPDARAGGLPAPAVSTAHL